MVIPRASGSVRDFGLRLLGPLICLVSFAGCVSLQRVSSGHVGCKPKDIQISDVGRGMSQRTWTATCHNVAYSCSQIVFKESSQVACAPTEGAPAAPASRAARIASTPAPSTPSTSASAEVTRVVDESRKATIVKGKFGVSGDLLVGVLGVPKLHPGTLQVAVQGPILDRATRECKELTLLVNGQPMDAVRSSSQTKAGRVHLESSFEFASFKPLAKRFPEFAVRACNSPPA